MIIGIITAAVLLGAVGCLIAVMLNVAGDKFYVHVNENVEKVRELLPGNNCGGCGYAGCDALAEAIADGNAAPNACPMCNNAAQIGEIVGAEVGASVKKAAYVHCSGSCEKAKNVGAYHGAHDCVSAKGVQGNGSKACLNGCMGFGTCVSVCQFDAIHIQDGIAVVDKEKCTACGQCVKACPNGLIELIPYDARVRVACASQEKGAPVKKKCSAGCLGCTLCTKQCPSEAITMKGNVPYIDYEKCTGCGVCAQKCPAKCIV